MSDAFWGEDTVAPEEFWGEEAIPEEQAEVVEKPLKLGPDEVVTVDADDAMERRAEGYNLLSRRTELAPTTITAGSDEYEVEGEDRNVAILQTPESLARRGAADRGLPPPDAPDRIQLQRPEERETSPGQMVSQLADAMRSPGAMTGAAGSSLVTRPVERYARGLATGAFDEAATYSPTAMAEGAGDVLTQGFSDEIGGAIRSAQRGTDYAQERDQLRREQSESAGRNPGSYALGAVGGMAAMAGAPNPTRLAQGPGMANALGRAGIATAEGTILGAVNAAGRSEEDVGTRQFAGDVAGGGFAGGVTGGATQGGAEGLGAFLRSRANAEELRDRASLSRLRGLFGADRPPRRTTREMVGQRGGRMARARQVDRELREAGITRAEQAPDVNEQAGEAMREAARQIDRVASSGDGQRTASVTRQLPARIAERIRQVTRQLDDEVGLTGPEVDAMEEQARRWERQNAPDTFEGVWQWRQRMARPEYWTVGPRGEMNPAHTNRRAIYGAIRDEMQRAAEQVSPEAAEAFRSNARRFAVTRPLAEAADEAEFRGAMNRQVSLTDTIAASAGGASGGLVGAVTAGGANRMVRSYEHGVKARVMDQVADVLERNPGALGPAGNALMNAMRRSPAYFAATYYAMTQQDPALRQRIRELQQEQDDTDDAATAAGEQ